MEAKFGAIAPNAVEGSAVASRDFQVALLPRRRQSAIDSKAHTPPYVNLEVMTATKGIAFGDRFFWAYDVAAGVFLKHLIDEAECCKEASAPWLSQAVSRWREQAAITEFGLSLEEDWSSSQKQTFIELAERACKKLATRESIPAKEIASWPLKGDLRIFPRTAGEVRTAPVIELGRAIIATLSGNLPRAPRGEAWFYGTPTGRSTIKMNPPWDKY